MTLPVPLNAWPEHQIVFNQPHFSTAGTPLPVPNSTKSFWFTEAEDVRPSPSEGSTGPLTDDADIAIIGSGITGVSAAYHLAKFFSSEGAGAKVVEELGRPVKAVILEAREFCSGATGRNGGHLTSHVFFEFTRLQKERGTEEAKRALEIENYTVREVEKILEETETKDFVDFVPGGRLNLEFTPEEHEEVYADYLAAKEAGLDLSGVQWFTKEETQEKYGASYPSLLLPGNNLWPLKLVSVLYNQTNKLGSASSKPTFTVDMHTRTPVNSIVSIAQPEPNRSYFPRRHSLLTPRGKISTSYVIHATNGYASHLLPHLSGPDGVVPTRGQIIATRAAVSEEVLTKTAGTGNSGFEYWFPRPIKSEDEKTPLVIVGGGREATRPRFELYEVDDSTVNEKVGKALRDFLPAVFPGYYEKDKEPEMEWTGIMGYTKSGDPFVGPVVDPTGAVDKISLAGQYVSAGYTGHGMPRAYACAEVVAQMIAADVTSSEWVAPEWFPRAYLTKDPNSK
ncbi:FAD dependent oxidoreductase [Panus rudis PR-1116 ss-1]|nr:FAD dependent oxidoreductase [Panus rudis PR-1116 ss-1]